MSNQESDNLLNGNITSCRICGEILFNSSRDICAKCAKLEDEIFQKTRNFLRLNPGATVKQICSFLKADPKMINNFITSGRLARAGIRKVAHECKLCHKIIYEGILCEDCEKALQGELDNLTGNIGNRKNL